jgi:hypothetical protein
MKIDILFSGGTKPIRTAFGRKAQFYWRIAENIGYKLDKLYPE